MGVGQRRHVRGRSKRYGQVYVDVDEAGEGTYDRYRKDSFWWYKAVCETGGASVWDE